jgi:hypothetical protein
MAAEYNPYAITVGGSLGHGMATMGAVSVTKESRISPTGVTKVSWSMTMEVLVATNRRSAMENIHLLRPIGGQQWRIFSCYDQ